MNRERKSCFLANSSPASKRWKEMQARQPSGEKQSRVLTAAYLAAQANPDVCTSFSICHACMFSPGGVVLSALCGRRLAAENALAPTAFVVSILADI